MAAQAFNLDAYNLLSKLLKKQSEWRKAFGICKQVGGPRVEYTAIYCKTFVDWKLQSKEMEPV